MSGRPCDCTVDCGDDPALKDGRAAPCAERAQALRCPRVLLVTRGAEPSTVVVHLSTRPSDAEFRDLSRLICHFGPPR